MQCHDYYPLVLVLMIGGTQMTAIFASDMNLKQPFFDSKCNLILVSWIYYHIRCII